MSLPKGWINALFSELTPPDAPIIYGILQPGPNVENGVPYVRPTEIDNGKIKLAELRKTSLSISKQYARSVLKKQDLILSIVGTIGKVAEVPVELEGGNITQSSCRIRIDPALADPRYARHFLRSKAAADQFQAKRLGTAVPRLNIADIRQFLIQLPPLLEQRRIIAKLDSLTARLAHARAELKRADMLQRKIRLSSLSQIFAKHLNSPSETLESLCRIGTGSTPKRGDPRYYKGGTIAWVTSGAVNQRLVDKPTEFITEAAIKETNCKVFPTGSLLVALYGEGKTRGKVAKLGIAAATIRR